MKLGAKQAELVQLMQKFVLRSRFEFLAANEPDPPIGPYISVLVRFVVFGCILDSFVNARNSMQSGLKW